ncbi:aminotransferase class V-fold PLP-dependent enzyme, partial [Bradyrhizobium sp.]|uniref:aminotransferase class V-fold PLP-dependent enzyme n=1 Tax=Bradyrhizobium sp. TaxID=376 RepID=UPI00292F29D6
MRSTKFVFAICFLFGLTAAKAAGVRNFDIPAGATGPAIRLLVWTPCAESPQEMDARGAIFFAVPGCPVTGEKLPLIVISHGRRGWFGGHHDTAAALADAGIYLDSAATALKPQAVIDATQQFYSLSAGNVHRSQYADAQRLTAQYEAARDQ